MQLGTRYPLVANRPRSGGATTIKHYPTDEVLGGILTRPLKGSKFVGFWGAIMGCTDAGYLGYKLNFGEPRGCKVGTGP